MDWISSELLECYKEHIKDESYIKSLKKRFEENNRNKYDGLLSILNADARIRESLAKRLGVDYKHFNIFLHVLKRT